MTHFKIIVAGYNCFEQVDACLGSIAAQFHTDFDVCVVDDCSTDERQWPAIEAYCNGMGWESIHHTENLGALRSQHEAIERLAPKADDVLVWVDLDDKFCTPRALEILDSNYDDSVLVTYGGYVTEPYSSTCHTPKTYPPTCVLNNDYRSAYTWGVQFGHLRTMRYSVYSRLVPEIDFQFPDGEWFKFAGDTAVMIPALELAAGRYRCIDTPMYCYTSNNPISDWRKDSPALEAVHTRIFTQIAPKEPM